MFSFKKRRQADTSELNIEFLLNAIVDGVVVVGADKSISLFSPAASAISGWPAEEAIGIDYRTVLPITNEAGQPYLPDRHPFTQALRTRSTIKDNAGFLSTKRGKLVPISLIVSPLLEDVKKMTTGVVGVFRDTTAERSEEGQRSEFVSTASHEMRTPIAAIEGYLSLALNPKVASTDNRARAYLEKAHDATKHLSQLFVDLLTSTQAEDGRLSSYQKVIELGEIVQQVVDEARLSAQRKSLAIRTVLSSDKDVRGGPVVRPLFYINADPNRIREVMANLVDNAIKYTERGEVAVALTGNSSIVQVQVRDTGIGIPADDLPHLFQKFYRVDNSMTRTIGGTGLGLFICRKIVELYNGRIWAESQPGKGSTFYINLPRLSSDQAMQMPSGTQAEFDTMRRS